MTSKTPPRREHTLIIAEAGINHNGDLDRAIALAEAAVRSGADCVKYQTFKAKRVVTPTAPKAEYQLETTDNAESQLEMLSKCELTLEMHQALRTRCAELGIQFLSTPYNFEDVDLLEEIGIDAYKIASGQIVELPFLKRVAQLGKPIILSTGMATLEEIDSAVAVIQANGNPTLSLLQCTTNYPSKIEDANLRVIPSLKDRYRLEVGYSDHTLGDEAAIAAVALGATIIEKHFTLDKSLPGPDHACSATPDEFALLAARIRSVEAALGDGVKQPTKAERANAPGMRRSIVTTRSIQAGDLFDASHLTFKRPASGLSPVRFDELVGKRALADLAANSIVTEDSVEW